MTYCSRFTVTIETDEPPMAAELAENIRRALDMFRREGELTAPDDDATIIDGVDVRHDGTVES